jgi:hypothetical protein
MHKMSVRRHRLSGALALALVACGGAGGSTGAAVDAAGADGSSTGFGDDAASAADAAAAGDAPTHDGGAGSTDALSDGATTTVTASDAAADADAADALAPLDATLTADFSAWLAAHGLAGQDFERAGTGGSFGGRAHAGDAITAMPIVFVHGNADAAIGRTADLSGWDSPRRYLLAHGWSGASLYGTTWGPADPAQAEQQRHDHTYLLRLRTFISAVQQYTGAKKVAVVAHSMGVTLARKSIESGTGNDAEGAYDLGAPITSIVDTFIGIAGANQGLTGCYAAPDPPACSKIDGFWPGGSASDSPAQVLAAMNATKHDEGSVVLSICSSADEVLGLGGIVWGRDTCQIPGEDTGVRHDSEKHVPLKDDSGPDLVAALGGRAF